MNKPFTQYAIAMLPHNMEIGDHIMTIDYCDVSIPHA